MRWLFLRSLVWLTIAVPAWAAAPKLYQHGEIVSVEQKARTQTLYYLVNTPVTKDEPYYQISVKVNHTIYVGEYTPRHSGDTLPDAWSPGAEVSVRVERRHFFVKGLSDEDIYFATVKHMPAASWQPSDTDKSAK